VAGAEILVYSTSTGELLKSLRGHKSTVYTLDWSYDGSCFASGGADKQVILWRASFEPFLKYSHLESIQSVAYHPLAQKLISCSPSDFGLWSPDEKSVTKTKVLLKN
jgi:intraflagellar transport protein 122